MKGFFEEKGMESRVLPTLIIAGIAGGTTTSFFPEAAPNTIGGLTLVSLLLLVAGGRRAIPSIILLWGSAVTGFAIGELSQRSGPSFRHGG